MAKASDNAYPSVLLAEQGAAPATPASGHGRLYIKADGVYFVNNAGIETGPFGASGGGGDGEVSLYSAQLADLTLTGSNAEWSRVTLAQADAPAASVTVRADLQCWFESGATAVNQPTGVEISLDGGTTWSAGSEVYVKDVPTTAARVPISAMHFATGVVTGDVIARVQARILTGSGKLRFGRIQLTARAASAVDSI